LQGNDGAHGSVFAKASTDRVTRPTDRSQIGSLIQAVGHFDSVSARDGVGFMVQASSSLAGELFFLSLFIPSAPSFISFYSTRVKFD
jgi:hypothetical protein